MSTPVPSSGRRIYDGVHFSVADCNYTDWLNSVYNAIKWNSLSRWAIPLVPGELTVQKPKPGDDEAEERIEAWEDSAEKALVLINESLGTHNWII
jgi:hypothetical protein